MRKIKLLSILLIIGFFVNPLSAQEVKKNFIYAWDDFSGGKATKPSPIDLPKKFGTICQNVRLNAEHKSLTKRQELFSYGVADTSEETTGLTRLYLKDGTTKALLVTHGDEIEVGDDSTGTLSALPTDTSASISLSSDYKWQWVTWHDLAIGCDGYNPPIKTDGTDATFLGTCYAEAKTTGGGPNGTYKYKVTFYTSSYEVLFNVASNLVTVANKDVVLTMIPIGPDAYGGETVIGRKVYRSDTGGAGTYNLIPNTGTIADNTTVTIDDSETDAAVDAEAAYPAGTETWTPPKGKFCVVHKNRLFFANDPTSATDTGPSTIYYSEDGSHDLFDATDAYFNIRKNDGDEITFVKNLLGQLCVGKTNTIQYFDTDGDNPAKDWEIPDPYSFVGCVAPYSVDNTPLGIFYVNWGGLYKFNGAHSKLLSDAITPTFKDISLSNFRNMTGKYHENMFYLAYASKESSKNDRCLVYDLITESFSTDIIDINCFAVLSGQDDWGGLYAGSSTDGEIYTYAEGDTLELSHSTHSDFATDADAQIGTWDDMGYLEIVEGGDPQKAVLDIRENLVLDDMSGNIDDAGTAEVDRPDTSGTYISHIMYLPGITAYSILQWNETIPAEAEDTTDPVYFQYRGGTTATLCKAASWDTTKYTTPSGSNISGETAYEYTQYRITLTTDDIDYTPTVDYGYGYTVRISYDILASVMETSIPLEWESGWTSLDVPAMYQKTLRKVECWHEGTSGDLILTFTTDEGITDTFTIDLSTDTKYYSNYFTDGALTGRMFTLNIYNSDMYPLKIKKVLVSGDIEPLV